MLKKYPFSAVIFDLDGVITQTALVHSAAWKKMFDGFLRQWSEKNGTPFIEFSHNTDYLPYVDGKPRYQGVASFLESRGISLPWGRTDDPDTAETICGLGNRKNLAFNEVLENEGVKVYQSTVDLIYELRRSGIRVGVASSSKNCEQVLRQAGILNLFETRVDGVVSAETGLAGKPSPDIFVTASRNLGVPAAKAVVVEDAVSGVQAGRNGNFGFVLGIARENNHHELLINGADRVVGDIAELGGIEGIAEWFEKGLVHHNYTLSYHDYAPALEKHRETLLTTGNGNFGTRGAMEETRANPVNYPATYMAGLYNRLVSKVAGRDVENEDFVNGINWLPVTFRVDSGDWFDPNEAEILNIERELDFRTGVLKRNMRVRFEGKTTRIVSRRFVSMHTGSIACQEYSVIPEDYTGRIEIRAGISANHINDGVERYRALNQQHLSRESENAGQHSGHVVVSTSGNKNRIACAYRLMANKGESFENESPEMQSYGIVGATVGQGESFTLRKIISLRNSLNDADPLKDCEQDLKQAAGFDELLEQSVNAWNRIWSKVDIQVQGDRLAQKILRMHLYHLFVTTSPLNVNLDAGIPARGLHGEAYRGHIFWDELYILPIFNLSFPEISRSVLMYRYRRLQAARDYAVAHGHRGAMFPWQSGSSGREETQVLHLNPVSGKWGDDYSSLQRHVSLAIAYNIWEYYHATLDHEFLENYGAEVFLDICNYWTGLCRKDPDTGRYHIEGVMGPDEFHEKYPGAGKGGLRDNAYTNLMVAWALRRAFQIREILTEGMFREIAGKIGLTPEEIENWQHIAHHLNIVFGPDSIIAQYDGYFDLKEPDWDFFRKKYGNVYRMDRLLKAEGLSPDDYKVAKQADALMIFYNLRQEEVTEILADMGYQPDPGYVGHNLKYYLQRTSHGSTLSRIVHAKLARMTGENQLGWQLYREALTSDYKDIQGGTTSEGIHAGVMAGTIWIALNVYAGLDLRGDYPSFAPALPETWEALSFNFSFRGIRYYSEIQKDLLTITAGAPHQAEVYAVVNGQTVKLTPGVPFSIRL